VRVASRWFKTLLRLFPARFRERHGADMRETFERAYEERRVAGRRHVTAFLVRTTFDLGASGIRERLATPGHRPDRGSGGGPVSWLDVKLGLRMLAKHPGLTLVSTLALAVGIPVGLAPAHFVDGLMAPLPVPEGGRIRTLRLWSPMKGRAETTTLLDFETWQPSLSSFQDLGAYRETRYNLDGMEGERAVRGAAVTASTFDILRVPPLLGRPIQPMDLIPGGENVAILGYDLWQARYGGDPAVVGGSIRLGSVPHTVIGVMPEGFHFPERQSIWTPLRATAAESPWLPASIFGRLADGVTDASAQAEFALVAARPVRPERDLGLEPQVVAHAYVLLPGLSGGLRATPEFLAFQTLALVVLLVACANVGMLVFARTATRGSELAVRTALGASRARIVAQVFTECLVLAVLASGLGIALMAFVMDVIWKLIPAWLPTALPYWIDWGISGRTAMRASGLAALSAVVAGVVPALRFTGASVQSTIQRARAPGTGARFGGLSGVLIVIDVAVAVTAVGFAATAYDLVDGVASAPTTAGIPAGEYLAVTLSLPAGPDDIGPDAYGGAARMAATQEALVGLLRAEPRVRTVAVADALPRMEHHSRLVEAEGVDPPGDRAGESVRTARVAIDFFESLGRPILAGRGFDEGDLEGERQAVIVNTTFVERVLGGQNAVGRRIRFRPWGDGEPGPWKEIVGVVGHLGMRMISARNDQGVYEPLAPGELSSVRLGIRVGEDPASFAPRLRALAREVDPDAIVSVTGPLDDVYEGDWYILLASSLGAGLLVCVLLALAASGIYAIMSFSVAQRTKEIGVRAALGASRPDLVRTVARRAIAQLGAGVLLGMPLSGVFFSSGGGSLYAGAVRMLLVGTAVMTLVGLLACTGPTLRALRVDPREALNETP
jgi:putative ABC transport system permease protein